MQRSFYENDIIFVSFLSYGIPIPSLYKYDINLLPDFNGNGHLYTDDGPKHGDIVTIKHHKKDIFEHYIKRCFARGGDEIIFTDKKIYLKTTAKINSSFRNLNGSKWYSNPYKEMFFSNERFTEFQRAIENLYQGGKDIRTPIFIKELKTEAFSINGKTYNAFYYKVPKDKYFVMGDNVDMSTDSRTFGAVSYEDILGKVIGVLRF